MTFRAVLMGFVLVLAACAPHAASADDLASVYPRAHEIVARHLTNPRLNSAYGTPAFDAQGKRVGDVFLNFVGQGADGAWMLMSLTVHADGSVTGEGEENNPRPDQYGHHLKPGINLVAWPAPEDAVRTAVQLHDQHQPVDGVSMACFVSADHQGRAILVLYWLRDHVIYDVVTDAKYGTLISSGQTQWPHGGTELLR